MLCEADDITYVYVEVGNQEELKRLDGNLRDPVLDLTYPLSRNIHHSTAWK